MEVPSHAWLEARDRHREFLFGQSTEIAPVLGDVAVAPFTTLTFDVGTMFQAERLAQAEILNATNAILTYHNAMAESDSGAVFGIGSSEDRAYVAGITAGVIIRWQNACRKRNRESPFANLKADGITEADFQREDVQLVVETASAVIEVLGFGYRASRNVHSQGSMHLMNLVARRGPAFAAAWARGDIVRDYCEAQGINPEEEFNFVSRPKLIGFAMSHPRDPLRALLRYAENLNEVLSLDNLVTELSKIGWSPQKTAAVFTDRIRHQLAARSQTPLEGAKRVAGFIDKELTTEHIAEVLNEDPEYVDRLFRPGDRNLIALSPDPLAKVRRVAANFKFLTVDNMVARLGWDRSEVEEIFTPTFCKQLAKYRNIEEGLRIVATLKTTLSVSAIAESLGWGEPQTATVFTLPVRKRLVALYGTGAVSKVRVVAATREQVLSRNYQLPIEIVNYLSTRFPGQAAIAAAGTVQREMSQCPPKVSYGIWMWAVAFRPNASREVWLRAAATSTRYFQDIINPLSLNTPIKPGARGDSKELGEYIGELQDDMVDSVFSDEPGVYLQELAAKAGATYNELYQLLAAFGEDGRELSSGEEELLGRLRAATTTGA